MLVVFFLVLGAGINAQTALENGNIAYGAQNFKQAITYYSQATSDHPDNTELLLKLAHSYRFTNDMVNAEKQYQLACEYPNIKAINYYYYGTVLKANKKYEQARIEFGKFSSENHDLALKAQESCDFVNTHINAESAFEISKEAISSPIYDDYAPVLHQNGLVFSSARKAQHDALPGGFSNPETQNFLYNATIGTDGKLSDLKIIKNDMAIMPTTNIAPFSITDNEQKAVSTYNEFVNGVRHMHSASLSRVSMEIHMQMKKIEDFVPGDEFPHVGEHAASFPCFANNGNTIYFSLYGFPGGYGGFDIWVIHYHNDQWTVPQNLGPEINSPGDEICPFLANNEQMYFASDFHKGFGGYDVFRSQKTEKAWTYVRNLGNTVNSSFDDLYFVFDDTKKTGYFSSNRDQSYNIYSAIMEGEETLMPLVNEIEKDIVLIETIDTIKNKNAQTETATSTSTNTTTAEVHNKNTTNTTNNNTVDVSAKPTTSKSNTVPCAMNFYIGSVEDPENKRPISGAVVYIKNQKTGVENKIKDPTNQYGEYSVILDPLCNYTIAISKSGFKNLVFDVNTGTGGKKTLLSTRSMAPSPMIARDKYGNIIQPDIEIVNTNPTDEELVNPPKSSGKTFTHESNNMEIPEKGYMIQVTVSSNFPKEDQLKLGQYGHVFTEKRGNKTAYRVGVFIDSKHLEQSLEELKITYKDAFKVAVELDNDHLGGRIALSSQVIYPLPAKEPLPLLNDESENVNETIVKETNNNTLNDDSANTESNVKEAIIAFKVQLGAYKQAEEISFSNISHLGEIEKEKKANGLTYFYISSFKTLVEARIAKTKALDLGIIAPFIVAFKNGTQVKISEVSSQK